MKKINLILITGLLLLIQSCYSVRISCKDCIPEKVAVMKGEGFYRDKKAHRIKLSQKLSVINSTPTQFAPDSAACPNGFYSIEYKVTLGQVLLSGITLGRVRRMNVIYVCNKETN
jgi:hypothetical protein